MIWASFFLELTFKDEKLQWGFGTLEELQVSPRRVSSVQELVNEFDAELRKRTLDLVCEAISCKRKQQSHT